VKWFVLSWWAFSIVAIIFQLVFRNQSMEQRLTSVIALAITIPSILWFYLWSGLFG
jgi:hypothetical protein